MSLSFKSWLLLEYLDGQKFKRQEYLEKIYSGKWIGLEGFENLKDFVEKAGKIDPTKNGAYMQWIVKLAIKNPQENRAEDLDRLGKDLQVFEANKSKIEKKDINAYSSYHDLYVAIEPFLKKRPKTAEEKKKDRLEKSLEAVKDEITIVYQGPEGWVRIPKTKKAAKYLGQSTRWCTSASSNNMFDHYNAKDSLFVIYDKEAKERFQLHIDSDQFADASDKTMNFDKVPKWAWEPIKDWYKKNAKISLKQLMTLSKHTDDKTLADNSDHKELLDLMKQYGV